MQLQHACNAHDIKHAARFSKANKNKMQQQICFYYYAYCVSFYRLNIVKTKFFYKILQTINIDSESSQQAFSNKLRKKIHLETEYVSFTE